MLPKIASIYKINDIDIFCGKKTFVSLQTKTSQASSTNKNLVKRLFTLN